MINLNKNVMNLLEERYFLRDGDTGKLLEHTPEEMFNRVAKVISKGEKTEELQKYWNERFYNVMANQLFMPNTPTLMNSNTTKCLSACSVSGRIPDSLEGIYNHMWTLAKLTKSGVGCGSDLSDIRPKGELIKSSGGKSAGVINWMNLIQTVATTTIQGDKARRSANMVSLRFNHPDIIDFIHSKRDNDNLTAMNISVTITDKEYEMALARKDIWLKWNGKKYTKINAGDVLDKITENAHANGDPGLLFLDHINKDNPFNKHDNQFNESNPHYMITSNPCGEQVLEANELCTLGSINIKNLYNSQCKDNIDWTLFKNIIQTGIRFLDDIVEVNNYPFEKFEEKMKGNRKIGLGVAGLAELLIKLNIPYDSQECLNFIDKLFTFKVLVESEYNHTLALEKGAFPNWKDSIYAKENNKVRCATISTQAPTGSISSILGNESYGIEPFFMISYIRRVMNKEFIETSTLFKEKLHKIIDDKKKEENIIKQCAKEGTIKLDSVPYELKRTFRCANEITPQWHLKVMAQLQKYYQNAISKTINLSEKATIFDVKNCYTMAYKLGLKGITIYRNNSLKGQTIQIGQDIKTGEIKYNTINPISRSKIGTTYGCTIAKKSACGRMYITINRDKNGNIVESFINTGKNGICKSNIEGVNRLVSLALRGGIKVEEIIDQLKSIQCPACTKVLAMGKEIDGISCPDVLARVLKKEYKRKNNIINNNEEIEQNIKKLTKLDKDFIKKNGQISFALKFNKCPECGEKLDHVDGCISCLNCSWSKCS